MMEDGEFTNEEVMEALSLTVEEIEELEKLPKEPLPAMGKFGHMYWDYLKENHPSRFTYYMMEMEMRDLCVQVNREAQEMMDAVEGKLRKQTPRPTGDFMEIWRYETAVRDQAEEIALNEVVFKIR